MKARIFFIGLAGLLVTALITFFTPSLSEAAEYTAPASWSHGCGVIYPAACTCPINYSITVTTSKSSGIACSGNGCTSQTFTGTLTSGSFDVRADFSAAAGVSGSTSFSCSRTYTSNCGFNASLSNDYTDTVTSPQPKQFYICQTSNSCPLTAQSYPDKAACESANPGKSCYNNQSTCLQNAPSECPAPPKRCHDNNGDGYADACQVNGNLPQTCENVSQCPQPPQKRCLDSNYDGAFDQCATGGTGPLCNNVNECLPPPKRCHDNNGDGYADACQVNGNLPQTCDNLSQCPQPPQKKCFDSNYDGVFDACSTNGTGPSCNSVNDCPIQQKKCLDSNYDGTFDQCSVNGTGPSCSSVQDCPTPQKKCLDSNYDGTFDQCSTNGTGPSCNSVNDCPIQQKKCLDSNYDGTFDQCSVNGTGPSCSSVQDCPAPQKKCLDSNYDGTFDQCATNGTGPSCSTFTQDCQTQTHKECVNYQCVVRNGPGSNQCAFDGDCVPQTHKECINYQCVVVNGAGSNLCLFDGDCTPQTHKECVNQQCVLVNGPGTNQCATSSDCQIQTHKECVNQQCVIVNGPGTNQCASSSDCAPQTHRECQNQQCVTVNGPGTNQCASNNDCQIQTHRECQNQQCVTVNGPGSNQCTFNSDCQVTQSHLECRNQQCVSVSGAGANLCLSNNDCQIQQSHRECRNEQCVTVSGAGSNLCTFNSDCQIQQSHRECRNEQCVTISGPGSNSCTFNSDCQFQQSHRECRNEQCVTVSGSGSNECTFNSDCRPFTQTYYYCTQNQQCSSNQYTSQSECERQTGRRCFSSFGSCQDNAQFDSQCGPVTRCGDGRLQRPNSQGQMEECDDGNTRDDGNGCSADCRLRSVFQNRCNDSNGDRIADSCSPDGNMEGSCNVLNDCLQNKICQACGCVEKTVDRAIAGDNQRVQYRLVISNKSNLSGTSIPGKQVIPIEIRDYIYQKKKFRNNDPVQGVEDAFSTEGYIEYPDQICISENNGSALVNGSLTSGCFAYHPGFNVANPTDSSVQTTPSFTVANLDPGEQIVFTYEGVARTTFEGHALGANTDFINITNEVRTQTNNDYANVTVSKPVLTTGNLGNLFVGGPDGIESVNVQNLALMFSSASNALSGGTDLTSARNIAGLIISPGQAIDRVSTYLSSVGQYLGFDTTKLASNVSDTVTNITRNTGTSFTNTVTSESDFEMLGKRPDNARIYTVNGDLTIDLGENERLSERSTIIVNGNVRILSDIRYASTRNSQGRLASFGIIAKGDFYIGEKVSQMNGIFIIDGEGHAFTGDKVAKQLTINGSLIGENKLLEVRTYVGDPSVDKNISSVQVNYDARVVSDTPPGIEEYLKKLNVQLVAP